MSVIYSYCYNIKNNVSMCNNKIFRGNKSHRLLKKTTDAGGLSLNTQC